MENPKPKDKEKILPAFELPFDKVIELPFPKEFPIMNFTEVLDLRRSKRVFNSISIECLSSLLYLCAKVKQENLLESGYKTSFRPSPSAGGRHPIDIFVLSESLFENKALHYYDPYMHQLKQVRFDLEQTDRLRNHLLESFPGSQNATVLWMVVFPERTESKYDSYESLVWRDVGALVNTIQLTSTFLRLNSCIAGTLGEPIISELFAEIRVQSGGAILIG